MGAETHLLANNKHTMQFAIIIIIIIDIPNFHFLVERKNFKD